MLPEGRRRRPAMKPKPNHRPANWTRLVRDIHIQFTIEFLKGVGVPPRGTPVSGCRIVAEALGVPELTVVGVWKDAHLEKILRAHDAEILGGHRHSPRALPDSLRREPPLGSRLDLPLSGRGRPSYLPAV